MHLIAGRTLDRVLILDRQRIERLRVHREACINELARIWALDHDAVQPFLISARTDEAVASKGPLSASADDEVRDYLAHLTSALT
jgi:hypothetical protein